MIQDDLLITIVIMFLLSILAVLLILFVMIFTGVNFYKTKKFKINPVHSIIIVISFIILYLGLPFWFLGAANDAEAARAENMHKLSVKTSVLPSVKSFMLAELGGYYMRYFEGEKAIKAFEESIKIKENKPSSASLCLLYSFKADREKAIDMCSRVEAMQTVAIMHILEKDYKTATGIINKLIETRKHPECWNYAIRAYINRKNGNEARFESDYRQAETMCPGSKELESLYKNKNYYEDFYSQKKKEFKF